MQSLKTSRTLYCKPFSWLQACLLRSVSNYKYVSRQDYNFQQEGHQDLKNKKTELNCKARREPYTVYLKKIN